jgi:hypothetical protein
MDRDALEREAERLLPELAEVARQPARWRALSDEQLERLLFRQCVLYDLIPDDPRRTEDLMQLYALCAERLPLEARGRVLEAVADECAKLEHAPNGLLPFLYRDPEPSVVAGASLQSAVLFPLEDGDPLTGPRTMHRIAGEMADDHLRGGILAGLLLLGDRRVTALLHGCWRTLGDDAADILAQARSGVVQAAHVEFLLDALEAQRDHDARVGTWAGGLVQLRTTARHPRVVDVERKLPVWAHDARPPVRVLREWTFEDYAATAMAPRLHTLAAREAEPRVLPAVLEAWGVAQP